MKFILKREHLLKSLQQVSGLLSGRPILPILNNLLLRVNQGTLSITSTDLEIEITARIMLCQPYVEGTTTIPARKFFDICRNLPEEAEITVQLESNHIIVRSNQSRFSLSTFSSSDFPNLNDWKSEIEFTLPYLTTKRLIEATQFSMACQDVRYYLNGMLFETKRETLHTVATDGHRLAICSMSIDMILPNYSIIVPRKGVIELMKMLNTIGTLLNFKIGKNNIRIHFNNLTFTSKLIDGHFPDYRYVLPKNPNKILEVNCNLLKQAFIRTSILSNEKLHIVRLYASKNKLKIIANNSEQEEAEEILDITYIGDEIEIGFNVSYLLDILNALKCDKIRILITDSISSVQIEDADSKKASYIVMPMRL